MKITKKFLAIALSLSMLMSLFAMTASAEEVSLKINFSNETSRGYPDGYLNDLGHEFADRGNGYKYGWNEDHTGRARDRGDTIGDRRLDTIVQAAEGGSWKIEVPNGTYEVEVALTDASYGLDKAAYLYVNGVTFVEDLKTSKDDPTVVVTNEVTVDNGVIEFTVGPAVMEGTKLAYTHITSIELDEPAASDAPVTPEMPQTGMGGAAGSDFASVALITMLAAVIVTVALLRMRQKGFKG